LAAVVVPKSFKISAQKWWLKPILGFVGGVLTWSKVLRLIPNTAIANLPIIFYNGQAVTFTPAPGAPFSTEAIAETIGTPGSIATVEPTSPEVGDVWLDLSTDPWTLKVWYYISAIMSSAWVPLGTITPGLLFPVGDYFDLTEVILPAQGPTLTRNKTASFNVQYVILNDTPVSSGLTLGDLTHLENTLNKSSNVIKSFFFHLSMGRGRNIKVLTLIHLDLSLIDFNYYLRVMKHLFISFETPFSFSF
jgi:hypothetical protein